MTIDKFQVRVAWKENRQKNEKQVEQVEVVARQIPGRSRPTTSRSRGFVGIDKPTILYSRQELAERLRLAWKHREENKANINIFLAHGILNERCESEMSTHTTVTNPPSPVRKIEQPATETPLINNFKTGVGEKKETENPTARKSSQNDATDIKKNCDVLPDCKRSSEISALKEIQIPGETKKKERQKTDDEKGPLNEKLSSPNASEHLPKAKKSTATSNDCSSGCGVLSTMLPSIKIENSTLEVGKVSKQDFSSAKQKRASFRSGTNQAFLDPVRSPTEFRYDSVSDKNVPYKPTIDNLNVITEKTCANRTESGESIPSGKNLMGRSSVDEKNVPQRTGGKLSSTIDKNTRVTIDDRDALADCKTMTQATDRADQFDSDVKESDRAIYDRDGDSVTEKTAAWRNSLKTRCDFMNERNVLLKKPTEIQRTDQRPRRTNSAPPQRCLESTSANNRVLVNIVIDSSSTSGKNNDQGEKLVTDCTDNAVGKIDASKLASSRSMKSAPLKRRSRSVKRRFWSCKNDADGKLRGRSAGRARNSIDFRTIDIVTMVSLVSSADSDSDTENSPGDDKLIDELRSKLPTTSIIKTPALTSARKPTKSVSFQKDSFDDDSVKEQPLPKEEKKRTTTQQSRLAIVNQRGNEIIVTSEETVSWRTDVGSEALPVLALIHDTEEPLDVPLTDREKRCLAVPIGDSHDKKRKLLKTRNTTSRPVAETQASSQKIKIQESSRNILQKMEIPMQQNKASANNSPINFVSLSKESVQPEQSVSNEPHLQTNKEKECWHLYRKMCDKGVCVSFDTVLRGMLTPTEYRLRQKELSQNL
ncbi:uncharacterized protein LOC108628088 isoform X2 [Ceratina calcarata]|uniref:Uncharacterized protein LOC108628088 isoform X2 n=1 Tax=Ceratina calcarata TaxID=156304 RepID=A0AAJ7J5E9_9HYME|nr:uncharacterized protein LOC108628088 isoform X2 [Ceratina calcarata]